MRSRIGSFIESVAIFTVFFGVLWAVSHYADVSRRVFGELRSDRADLVSSSSRSAASALMGEVVDNVGSMRSFSIAYNVKTRCFGRNYKADGRFEQFAKDDGSLFATSAYVTDEKFKKRNADDAPRQNVLNIVWQGERDDRSWWRFVSYAAEPPAWKFSYLSDDDVFTLRNSYDLNMNRSTEETKDSGSFDSGVNELPGLGGLAGMLRWIQLSYDLFDVETITIGEKRYAKISGALSDAFKSALDLDNDQRDGNIGKSEEDKRKNRDENEKKRFFERFLPTYVEVYVDENKLPCKIDYYLGNDGERELLCSIDFEGEDSRGAFDRTDLSEKYFKQSAPKTTDEGDNHYSPYNEKIESLRRLVGRRVSF